MVPGYDEYKKDEEKREYVEFLRYKETRKRQAEEVAEMLRKSERDLNISKFFVAINSALLVIQIYFLMMIIRG